jgi:hypothetical protein
MVSKEPKIVEIILPVIMSQMCMLWWEEQFASCEPSGEKMTELTSEVCPPNGPPTGAPDLASQM